jgi:hypothetical protein
MKRLFAAAAVLAACTHAAFAGEMTLFADSDFRGARVTVQRDAPDLNRLGFNDRVSSLVVRSGLWLVCEHRDFGGYCAELGPGEYRSLPNFNDSISSVREISRGGPGRGGYDRGGDYRDGDYRGEGGWRNDRDGRDGRRDDYRGGGGGGGDYRGGGAVELFSGARFEGEVRSVGGELRTLNDVGFNDRAGSIIIREGSWQFCEHADFRGECVVYGPGRYPFLDRMGNRISSMRRVR